MTTASPIPALGCSMPLGISLSSGFQAQLSRRRAILLLTPVTVLPAEALRNNTSPWPTRTKYAVTLAVEPQPPAGAVRVHLVQRVEASLREYSIPARCLIHRKEPLAVKRRDPDRRQRSLRRRSFSREPVRSTQVPVTATAAHAESRPDETRAAASHSGKRRTAGSAGHRESVRDTGFRVDTRARRAHRASRWSRPVLRSGIQQQLNRPD
jgi:hypothetical protein